MSTTIDSLELEVQSSATSAVSGIDALSASLFKLKSAVKGGVGLTSVANQLKNLNTALQGVDASSAGKLNTLANSLQKLQGLGGLKISSSISNQITAIGTATRSLSGTDFSALGKLATAVQPLANIGTLNLSSTISQLNKLPGAIGALNSVDMTATSQKIRDLVNALIPLTAIGKSNLTSFFTQIGKLPQIVATLNSINMQQLTSQIQQLSAALAPLASQMNAVASGFAAFPARIQRLITSTNNLSGANNRTADSYVNLWAKCHMALSVVKNGAKMIASWITKSNAYIENLSLFTASMGSYAQEAQKYAESVGEIMGIDPGEWMHNQGVFNTIISGFGVASDKAYLMSQNLTQLGYDISSFFNISFEDAMQKLQSGISGELEPLRRLGYDLSVARLQQEALNLGIEKSVSDMTQAEKSQLRYYAIMTQVTVAQGDMARTLNAPANQLRVLQAQVTQCARALGNIFIPVLNAVLPYAIALAKVIRMIADVIARLFGFELPKVDYSGVSAGASSVADSVGDIGEGLGKAAKNAKKLKSYLLGIDELNVIQPPEDSTVGGGSGGGAGVGGGDLGFELPTYDFLGNAVNQKIDEIVQKMKEWLGLTDDVDTWAEFFQTRLGKILETVGEIGVGFAAWKIAKSVVDFLNSLKAMKGFSSPFAAIGSIGLLSDLNEFIKYFQDFMENSASFQNVAGMLSEFTGAIGDSMIILGNVKLGGALKVVQGIGEIVVAIKDISESGVNWDNANTAIRGLTNIAIGIGVFTKNLKVAGWSLAIQGFTSIIMEISDNWTAIKQGDWSGVDKVTLAIGALEVLGGLAVALDVFSKFKSVQNIGKTAKIVETVSNATSGLDNKISKSLSVKNILTGLGDIALIIGGVIALVEAIGLLMQVPGFEQIAKKGIKAVGMVFSGLWDIILPLTAISAGIVGLGKIGVATVAKGFSDFAIIIGGAAVLITAIGALISIPYFSDFLDTGVNSVVSVFNGLWEVALPIGTLSALLIALGIATPAVILSGLAGFASVIGGIELVLVALGALKQIPGFSWIVGEGGKVLVQLGEILGAFAGSIVNSFLVKVSDSFPEIGKNLADFMTEAQPFFTGLGSINAESVDAAKKLAEMVLILTATDVLDGLTSWFTGGSSMVEFGKELCDFAPYFVQYSKSIKGVDGNAVQASATAAKSLAEFANNIPNSGGVAGFFAGENDIDVWGAKLPSFGRNFKEYSDSVKGVDGNAVQASATAAKSLAEFANNIPNEGGVVSWFTGDNNIDVWGEKLPKFGRYFKQYSDTVSGVKSDVVTASSAAAKSVVEFANNIPNEGGIVSWFTGDNSIDVWGAKLPEFGRNFLAYYNYIKNVKNDVITASSAAVQSIVGFANNIPNSGGVASWFAGDNSISAFADELVLFGQRFKSYYDYISGITISIISSVSSEMNKILDWSVRVSDTDSRDIESFGEAIKQLGSDFAACGGNIIEGFTGKITSAYTTSKSSVVSWGSNVKNWFTLDSYGGVNKQTFGTYGTDIINGFKDKVVSGSSSSKFAITSWATNIKNWFTLSSYGAINKETFGNYAQNVIDGFKNKIGLAYTNTKSNITTWASNVKTWFRDINSDSAWGGQGGIAYNVIEGFKNGITSWAYRCKDAVVSWGQSVINWFQDTIEEHSPSRVFYRSGVFTVKGYNNAVTEYGRTTKGVMEKWANSFTSFTPKLAFAVDTSALSYYDSASFEKTMSAEVTGNHVISADGFAESMEEFYREYVEPTLHRMAEDVKRQADKEEQTIVQVGNRTVTDAVVTQQKANGYKFTK